MVEPNRVTDDVGGKSVTLTSIHHRINDQQRLTYQYRLGDNGQEDDSGVYSWTDQKIENLAVTK